MKLLSPYLVFIALLLLSGEIKAQTQLMNISIHRNSVEIRESKLYVDFDINISNPDIRSNQGLVLTPIIQSAGGVMKKLPEVIINGKNRNISYNRTVERADNPLFSTNPYAVIRLKRRADVVIPYRLELPAETWMKNSTLFLQEDLCACRGEVKNSSKQLVVQHIETYIADLPLLTYLSPISELSNRLVDSICSAIYFPRGESVVLPDYGQNKQNITLAASVLTNKEFVIIGVNMIGAASPEGTYDFNELLSKERVFSLYSFFKDNYNVSTLSENIEWIGEDWTSLRELVSRSDMPNKQQVIDIIDSSKEKSNLMKFESGIPYRYIEKNFFPQLRRVSFAIHYKKHPLKMAQMRQLIVSNPEALDVNDMLYVANSYPQGSAEYNKSIEIAVKRYSNNWIANINASSVSLRAGNIAAAKQYLERVDERPESWNNWGVLYMLQGNYKLARQYFQKAIDAGSIDAKHNMKSLLQKE